MDKPIHTIKEWHSKKASPCVGLVGSILRDWAKDREILEARIAELEEEIEARIQYARDNRSKPYKGVEQKLAIGKYVSGNGKNGD